MSDDLLSGRRVRRAKLSQGHWVLLAAAVVLVIGLSWKPFQVHRAKVWCEELAALMLVERQALEQDPSHFFRLHERVDWYPVALLDEHSFGWDFDGEHVVLEFGIASGNHTFHSGTGDWSSGPAMTMVEATPVESGGG